MTFSIGAATFLSPPNSLDTLIRRADATMYAIKAKGKDSVSVCVMGSDVSIYWASSFKPMSYL
jgi:PleD family two-component response regulator